MTERLHPLHKAWIWLWYNDITRLMVLIGVPVIPVLVLSYYVFGPGEYLRLLAGASYIVFFCWAMLDNDYSNLRRIGLDEFRNKITKG